MLTCSLLGNCGIIISSVCQIIKLWSDVNWLDKSITLWQMNFSVSSTLWKAMENNSPREIGVEVLLVYSYISYFPVWSRAYAMSFISTRLDAVQGKFTTYLRFCRFISCKQHFIKSETKFELQKYKWVFFWNSLTGSAVSGKEGE